MGEQRDFCPEGTGVVGTDMIVDPLDVLEDDPLAALEPAEPCLMLLSWPAAPGSSNCSSERAPPAACQRQETSTNWATDELKNSTDGW
jgi:hypothetical protein